MAKIRFHKYKGFRYFQIFTLRTGWFEVYVLGWVTLFI